MVVYIVLITSFTILFLLLSVYTYFTALFPVGFFLLGIIPFVISVVLSFRLKTHRNKLLLFGFATLVITTIAYLYNENQFTRMTKEYFYKDSTFNIAAREIMPELSTFNEANEVAHYHGLTKTDEWLVVRVSFSKNDFQEHLSSVLGTYLFYEDGPIYDAIFCWCNNPFYCNDYQFYIIDIGPDLSTKYAAAIGINESEQSFLYIFVESENFQYMGFDLITETILSETEMKLK